MLLKSDIKLSDQIMHINQHHKIKINSYVFHLNSHLNFVRPKEAYNIAEAEYIVQVIPHSFVLHEPAKEQLQCMSHNLSP